MSRPGITFEFWVTQVSDGRVADASNPAGAMTGASSERVRQLDCCEGSKVTLKSS